MIPDAELTDEEIKTIQIETNNRISRFCNDCEGNFNQADIDAMYDEGNRAIAKAAQEKLLATLAAVPDKQMVKAVAKYLASTHSVSPEMDAEAIVALIQPIYTARQDKAVHQAIETTHAAADGTYGAMLAEAIAKGKRGLI